MIANLLIFRLKQVYRFAREIGRIRFGILLFLAVYILLTFKKAADNPFGAGSVTFITALLALSFRLGRPDKRFLQILQISKPKLYFSEFVLFGSPILVVLGMGVLPLVVPGLLLLFGLLSFLPDAQSAGSSGVSFLSRLLPAPYFEQNAGLRANGIFLLPIYAGVWYFYDELLIGVLGALFISMIVTSFYREGEARVLVEVFADKAGRFLAKKMGLALRFYILIMVPLLLPTAIARPDYLLIIAGLFLIGALLQIFAVLCKYAFYEPGESPGATSVFNGIALLCLSIPFFAPLPLFLGIRFYRKSMRNLTEILPK